ncbi:MAG: PEP-CTERM sorting domain-containing protein [Fibrobacter sp.]|nr:PEP-CTERM sorting domain-containing protein [Fibrobacter sp.]
MKLKMLTYVSGFVFVTLFVSAINAAYITIPYDANVYISFLSGEAASNTEFGIGTSNVNRTPLFINLPNNSAPKAEVFAGSFSKGSVLDFYLMTSWGSTYWAFSDYTDQASNIAFLDVNNSLNLGGSTIQRISETLWQFHLDDAASYNVDDDDDNDIVLQMRLAAVSSNPPVSENVPEPSTLILMASGILGFVCMRKLRIHKV